MVGVVFLKVKKTDSDTMVDMCSVCLEPLTAAAVRMSGCTHRLHAPCAFELACSEALREDASGAAAGVPCPLCRTRGQAPLETVRQLLRDPRMSQQVVADMVKTVIGMVGREEERWRLQLNAETALKIQSGKRRLCVCSA